jgi:hypothetical protein
MQPRKKSDDDWVARILEIRASDEHHVYARVYWMYWPDELPQGTQDGKKVIQGRQPYHGMNELVASNHSKQPWLRHSAPARAMLTSAQWTSSTSLASRRKPK